MHKSDECVLENLGNLKRLNVVPTTNPETPQVMNTCAEPKAL